MFLSMYLPNPWPWKGCDLKLISNQSKTGLNSEFFFWTGCLTKAKEPSLPYYLLIATGMIHEFMPFPRTLAQSETQTALSRIWTRIANLIS